MRLQSLIHIIFSARGPQNFWIYLIISLCWTFSLVEPVAAAYSADAHYLNTPSAATKACQQASESENWYLKLAYNYSYWLNEGTQTYFMQQSATIELTFGDPARSDTEVVWLVTQSRGTASIIDNVIHADRHWYNTIRGKDKASVIGLLRLDRIRCTYDLLLVLSLEKATYISPDAIKHVPMQRIGEIYAIERPIATIDSLTSPRLVWSGAIPAVSNEMWRQNDVFVADGAAASFIRELYRNRGLVNVGNATLAWSARSQPESCRSNHHFRFLKFAFKPSYHCYTNSTDTQIVWF